MDLWMEGAREESFLERGRGLVAIGAELDLCTGLIDSNGFCS